MRPSNSIRSWARRKLGAEKAFETEVPEAVWQVRLNVADLCAEAAGAARRFRLIGPSGERVEFAQ